MADWRELPLDIIIAISEKLEFFEDLIHFYGVCNSWRQSNALTKPNSTLSRKTPWLILETRSRDTDNIYVKNLKFYPVHKTHTIHHEVINLPRLPKYIHTMGGTFCLSTRGWLVYISESYEAIALMHPISLEIIECPLLPQGLIQVFQNRGEDYSVYNSVMFSLSENPAKTSEFTLAMIGWSCNRIGVWCSRDTEWVVRKFPEGEKIVDINFYKGELYHVNGNGLVKNFASGKRVNSYPPWAMTQDGLYYLVKVNGALLIVSQETKDFGDEKFFTTKCFKAWELDVESGMKLRVWNLGSYAIFLGLNSSFSIEACSSNGIKGNCVYHVGKYKGSTIDMGVYELWSENKLEDHYDPSDPRFCWEITDPKVSLQCPFHKGNRS